MNAEAWLTLAVIWMAAVATPGPNVAFTVATGLATPRPAAYLAAVGIGLGGIVYAVLALSGLGALLYASPTAFAAVRWLGVAYLAWLGMRALRPPARPDAIRPERPPAPGGRLVAQGFGVMMANPKAVLAVGAILPPFMDPARPALPQVAIMAATICAGSILVHAAYIVAAGQLAAWRPFTARPRLMRSLAGLVYLTAAAALAAVGI